MIPQHEQITGGNPAGYTGGWPVTGAKFSQLPTVTAQHPLGTLIKLITSATGYPFGHQALPALVNKAKKLIGAGWCAAGCL